MHFCGYSFGGIHIIQGVLLQVDFLIVGFPLYIWDIIYCPLYSSNNLPSVFYVLMFVLNKKNAFINPRRVTYIDDKNIIAQV